MPVRIKIRLNDKLYLRDPQETSLGQEILHHSILLLDEIGFEDFNFKRLAKRIESSETSVYRYFRNKQMLLNYLVSWYLGWVLYLIDIYTINIEEPKKRLKKIINILVYASKYNLPIEYVNKNCLHRLIIKEGSVVCRRKKMANQNDEFPPQNLKKLVKKISAVIIELAPNFPYPIALANNLVEMANRHIHFALHLPDLTEVSIKGDNFEEVKKMLEYFAFTMLRTAA